MNDNKKSEKTTAGSGKKLGMRIFILLIVAVMFLGIIILPFI